MVNRRYLHIVAAAVTLLGLSAGFAPAPRLLWNASHSAPVGLYRIDPGAAPVVGDWVAIAPPTDLADYMARRNYLPRGVPLLKRVAALPGARVCRSGVFVTVDGRAVARALARDRAGRPLPAWLGCRIVQPREIFLINAARDSLDGRYFGPLPTSGLLGTAHPILTRDAPGAPLRWRPSGRDLAFPRSEME
ncbi:S26 family signal peptidase [Sphingopyxis sp. SE2]|uniref:S26 family signal peptidase n=1 Tax=Sphingopyxis sp. SE2 TaxID=1586240 RepID=UPI003918CFC5